MLPLFLDNVSQLKLYTIKKAERTIGS